MARQAERDASAVQTLADAYLEAKAEVKRPGSLRDDRAIFKQIVLPTLGKRPVKDVTAREIETLHQSLAKIPYRANRCLALLSNAFNMAIRWGGSSGSMRIGESASSRRMNSPAWSRC